MLEGDPSVSVADRSTLDARRKALTRDAQKNQSSIFFQFSKNVNSPGLKKVSQQARVSSD